MARRRNYKRDRRGRFARTTTVKVGTRGSEIGEVVGFVAGGAYAGLRGAAVGATVGRGVGRTVDRLIAERRAVKGRRV